MSGLKQINDAEFSQAIATGVTLVDFWAPWCGPCKALSPVLEEVAKELGDKVSIVKINIDNDAEVAGQFGIMSIPTLLLFKDGQKVNQKVGALPKAALIEFIKTAL